MDKSIQIFLIIGMILSLPVLRKISQLCKTEGLQKGWNVTQIALVCTLLVIDICYAIGEDIILLFISIFKMRKSFFDLSKNYQRKK